jgi:hypothetical protein
MAKPTYMRSLVFALVGTPKEQLKPTRSFSEIPLGSGIIWDHLGSSGIIWDLKEDASIWKIWVRFHSQDATEEHLDGGVQAALSAFPGRRF